MERVDRGAIFADLQVNFPRLRRDFFSFGPRSFAVGAGFFASFVETFALLPEFVAEELLVRVDETRDDAYVKNENFFRFFCGEISWRKTKIDDAFQRLRRANSRVNVEYNRSFTVSLALVFQGMRAFRSSSPFVHDDGEPFARTVSVSSL